MLILKGGVGLSNENWLKEAAYQDYMERGMSDVLKQRLSLPSCSLRKLEEEELNYYKDVSDVPAHRRAAASLGSYKISARLLHKLISKRILTGNGSDIYGASNSCICTIIYLCTICDVKGLVEDFRIQDLVGKTCSSERGAYYVLTKLEEKGIIRVTCHCKNGYRDIYILDNDFSDFKKEKSRYLNLNRSFFNVNDESEYGFSAFKNLSLFAKKLFLYSLFEYDAQRGRHGYHSYIYRLAKKIGIKNELLIKKYVDEIAAIAPITAIEKFYNKKGPVYTYSSRKEEGVKKDLFAIRPHGLDFASYFSANAPTCLKHKITGIFRDTGVVPHIFLLDDYDVYKLPVSSSEYEKLVEEVASTITWYGVAYKNSPITVSDILEQFRTFLLYFNYFSERTLHMFRIYIGEFVRLSRELIQPGYVIA